MSIDSNFEELLSLFIERGVRFLVVGGYAYSSYGIPRGTKDLDLWVDATPENAEKTWRALAEFGMALGKIVPSDLASPGPWLQFGREPQRVDVLTHVDGLVFADAWKRRKLRRMGDVDAPMLSIDDLIANKRAVGRPQDVADLVVLERRRAEGTGEGRVSERTAASPRKPRRRASARRRANKRRH